MHLKRYKLGAAWENHSKDMGGVTHLAWRPDGNVLAAVYELGQLQLLSLLEGKVLQTLQFGATQVRDLAWEACGDIGLSKPSLFPPFESLSSLSE